MTLTASDPSPIEMSALDLYQRRLLPVPLVPREKRPASAGWQSAMFADADAVRLAFSRVPGAGLGVRLGAGLADVDLDSATARRGAPFFLPRTAAKSGRKSSPASHWWYTFTDSDATTYVKHNAADGGTVVELRATNGHQTAVPPTIHPSGESYEWVGEPWGGDDGPGPVASADLRAAVAALAMASVLADAWPQRGSRHDAYLALAGGLLRGCHADEAMQRWAAKIVEGVARLSHDEEANRRVGEVLPSTLEKLAIGRNVSGWTTLSQSLSVDSVKSAQKAADALRDALGVRLVLGPEVTIISDQEEESFWTARPFLTAVREFARARRVGPWALLGAVLALADAAVPPSVVLPPTRGGVASLNLYVGLCGASGSGKSAATEAAREFLQISGGVIDVLVTSAGSGEGLIAAYCHTKQARGKAPEVVQHRAAVLLDIDEVGTIASLVTRNGSTLLPVLKTAWNGKELGTQNAEAARLRRVGSHAYRLAVVCGIQPAHAGAILDDASGGFPQRWLWMPTYDANLVPYDVETDEPTPWAWRVPGGTLTIDGEGTLTSTPRRVMELPDIATAEILTAAAANNRPIGAPVPQQGLDGHALLTQAKVSGVIALIDGREAQIDVEDWQLAGTIMAKSAQTRAEVIKARQADDERANVARGRAEGVRAAASADAVEEEKVRKAGRWVMGKLKAKADGLSRSELLRAARSTMRPHLDDALEGLIKSGRVERESVEYQGQTGTRYRAVSGGAW